MDRKACRERIKKNEAEGLIPLGFFAFILGLQHLIYSAVLIIPAAERSEVASLVASECKLNRRILDRTFALDPEPIALPF